MQSDSQNNKMFIERQFLSGLIKHPQVVADIDLIVSESYFKTRSHKVIYSVIKKFFAESQEINALSVAKEVSNSGIKLKDNINIYDYLEAMSKSQITEMGTIEFGKELCKTDLRRTYYNTATKIQKFTEGESSSLKIPEIISECDKLYTETTRHFIDQDEPKKLFEGVKKKIIERSRNPIQENGLLSGYPEFTRIYGGLRGGNIYAIVSRPGQGKTTLITDICKNVCKLNKVKILMLDTEMETEEIQLRSVSSVTQIKHWYVDTGNWRRNPEYAKKMKDGFEEIDEDLPIYHKFVAGMPIEQVLSIIRRWYFKEVGRGNKCLISYDYIKLTGEKLGSNWGEFQAIGSKVDAFKEISKELDIPILTAMQLNRSGESQNKKSSDVTDDSTAIVLSDRLLWFASLVILFRRKTNDEYELDGEGFGTHKGITLKSRYQGKDSPGHQDLFQRSDRSGKIKWVTNFINFNLENFRVEERGSLKDIIEQERLSAEVQEADVRDTDI